MSYGKRGGIGPNRGKTAIVYQVTLPDHIPIYGGMVVRKRVFVDRGGSKLVATGYVSDGKPRVVVWPEEPAWEGDFGRLTATRID